jgi:hypothetical protein
LVQVSTMKNLMLFIVTVSSLATIFYITQLITRLF